MKILMIASEAVPYAKTGGLGDVLGALPAALRSLGHEPAVFMPRHAGISLKDARRVFDPLPVWLGPARYDTSVWRVAGDVPFYFLDHPALYEREGLYGRNGEDYPDNHIRFAVFARAALAVARYIFRPDIVHCHDWQAGLVPAYLRTTFANDPTFLGAPVLFTIHNLGYQGLFPREVLADIALDARAFVSEGLEYYGQISFIKGGLNYSDWLNTVSPTYALEIQTPEYGVGMDGVLRAHKAVLSGVLNGVDYREWNPETDPHIAANYSVDDLAGKRECKRALLRDFGLPAEAIERPLLGIVTRLTVQKGAGLIAEIAGQLSGEGFYMVGLGSGDPEYEDLFRGMAAAHPANISVRLGYDNALAHRIEAGADMFLMPSLYEPCGLNQMYSLRYGTVPVVRATGGLDDTIKESTGFKFREYSGQALLEAVHAAGVAYADTARWQTIMANGMREDFSWEASAAQYAALYRSLSGRD